MTTKEQALEYHRKGKPGKIEVVATKSVLTARDLSLAYTPGRRRALPRDPEAAGRRVPVHGAREPGRRGLERHRGARPRQHRRAGRQARDGGQGRPVQALRGHRRVRHRARDRGPRASHRDGEAARADVRRHQPRGHPRAGVLRDRGAADRGDGHPRLPRRPARHRDHLGRGVPERARAHQPQDRGREGRVRGRRRRGHRLRGPVPAPRRAPREHPHDRQQGRDLRGPHRGHEQVQGPLRAQDRRAHARDAMRGADAFVGVSSAGTRDQGHGPQHGGEPDHLRDGEPRSRRSRRPRSRRCAATRSWRRAARTTRTRSTTCSASRSSSAARSTCARARSTSR